MAETLPTNMSTFKVVGRMVKGVADSGDLGQAPDVVPIVGATVTFSPSLNPPIIKVPGAFPDPLTIFLESVVAVTDSSGYLKLAADGSRGVELPYGFDPDIQPNGWTWNVQIVVGGSFPTQKFSITGSAGGVVDLATVIPVPANPGSEMAAWIAVVAQVEAARDATLLAKEEVQDLIGDVRIAEDATHPGFAVITLI